MSYFHSDCLGLAGGIRTIAWTGFTGVCGMYVMETVVLGCREGVCCTFYLAQLSERIGISQATSCLIHKLRVLQ